MRTPILLALLLSALFPTLSPAPVGPEPWWGVVTSIDAANRTFVCHRAGKPPWTYSLTDATKFLVGKKPGSVADLKTGETVDISYHLQGKTKVADTVSIRAP
jgi:hypothetical protein